MSTPASLPPGAPAQPHATSAGPQPHTGHKNKGCAVACGVLLIAGIVATIAGAYAMYFASTRAISTWLSETPKTFAASPLTPEAKANAQARVEAFAAAIRDKQSPPELLLTADEVNALVDVIATEHHLKSPARVSFADDKIHAELSVDLRGLYLNGSGDLSVGLSQGVLQVFANNIEINGREPPDTIKELTRSYNLAGPFLDDPDIRRILSQLEYVTVTNGKLKITPKPVIVTPKTDTAK